ncbi:hypothetical protein KCP74_14165 [Salmonella enterica subsp. enterica]|nr:hypothetical protein KCP74_14165 [Salmonella enterica subsp. enterica]
MTFFLKVTGDRVGNAVSVTQLTEHQSARAATSVYARASGPGTRQTVKFLQIIYP